MRRLATLDDLLSDLRAALPDPGAVVTDPELLTAHSRDAADLCAAGTALALVRPRNTEQVSAVLRAASRHQTPVVPQGARTGLAGAANAVDGAVLLSLTGMNRIVEIDPANRIAVVQPGVVNATLRRAVHEQGLYYPPDPGSWESSTIGGNVATNAGGMCCVKYGVTAEYVLALEVVLASGEVLRCGRRTAKGVAGYDLTRLFVGSEGTLGVITEITVRLRPTPEAELTAVAMFPDVSSVGAAVSAIIAAGHQPSLLELVDQVHLRAIEAYQPMGLDTEAACLLLIGADTGVRAAADLADAAAHCRAAGATEVYEAADPAEAQALMTARRLAYHGMEHLAASRHPAGGIVVDDVAVPRTRLVELCDGVARIAAECDLTIGMLGHVGDGNLHPNIVVDRADPDSMARGRRAFDAIMALGLALGGTSTGEHGVGLLKRDWLAQEAGPVGMRIHQSIKAALDPAGILNPGKVL